MTTQQQVSRECLRLFIDETGTANPLDVASDTYVLSGCSIKKVDSSDLKTFTDQIKFKYWGRTDIVFHSREIGRKEGDFEIFKDPMLLKEFLHDLENLLSNQKFKMFFIIVDKTKARQAGWGEKKIYKDTTLFLVRQFILILLTTAMRGEIIIESASAEKDIYLLRAFGFFLGAGLVDLKIDYETIQDILTSVSFVTKKNHDTEEQVADLLGYAARLHYLKQQRKRIPTGPYEDMILRSFNRSLFKVPQATQPKKVSLFTHVEPFLVIP